MDRRPCPSVATLPRKDCAPPHFGKRSAGPENATLSINNFKKTGDRMKKLCALLHIEFFSEQDNAKIVNLMKAFWFCDRLSEAMSFSRFALLSQKSQFTYQIFSIVWLPQVNCQLLLCKAKPAWIIKRSIHYVTLQHYKSGGSYSKKFLPTSNVTFDTKWAHLKMTLPRKNGCRIKTPSSKLLILVSFCRKKNVLLINALTNLI